MCPWELFRSFKVCSDAKERVRGAESNGKLPHLTTPSKTGAWVPEFAVEDLPSRRTEALVAEFAVKNLPFGRTLMMISIYIMYTSISLFEVCIIIIMMTYFIIYGIFSIRTQLLSRSSRFIAVYEFLYDK